MNAPQSGKRFGRMADAFKRSAVYYGERGDWYIVAARTRDSDALDRSNFDVMLTHLGGESDGVAVEEASHWLCGWLRYLIVAPDNRAGLRAAIEAHCAVSDYPVLNDEHFSNLEGEEFWEFAESELKQFDGWEDVMRKLQDEGNYFAGCGDSTSEWKLIEAVREYCENPPPPPEPIDPNQLPLFPL